MRGRSLFLLICLTACGGDDGGESAEETAGTTETGDDETDTNSTETGDVCEDVTPSEPVGCGCGVDEVCVVFVDDACEFDTGRCVPLPAECGTQAMCEPACSEVLCEHPCFSCEGNCGGELAGRYYCYPTASSP